MRIRGLSLKTRQTFRAAAATWHDPDVVRVRETDLSGTHGRSSQQSSLTSVSVLSADWYCNDEGTESEQKYAGKHGACPPEWKCEMRIANLLKTTISFSPNPSARRKI